MNTKARDDRLLLGIEIGGTKLQVGLGRPDGGLIDLQRLRVEPERGAEGILAQILAATDELLQRAGAARADLAVVGIGFGGPVDSDQGVVVVSNQVAGWTGFPLAAWVRQTLGVGVVVVQNDAATAALGEARRGAGVGFDPVLYVTIGSGIGGGLIVGGAIYRGSGRGAIEIGHLWVDDLGPATSAADPRARITLEERASGWSIARAGQRLVAGSSGASGVGATGWLVDLAGGDPAQVTTELVARAAIAGDPGASAILAAARAALGQALGHAVTLLAPRRIILGGGVSLIEAEQWLDPIRREVDRRVFPPFLGSYDLVAAGLGEAVVVHGALALAADALRLGLGAGGAE